MRCGDCGATLPDVCNCEIVSNAPTTTVTGSGTGADPFEVEANLSGDPADISCGTDGLLGEFPARLLSAPRARVTIEGERGIAAGAGTFISFDRVVYDTDAFFNPANPTRLTAPVAGVYGVGGCGTLTAPSVTPGTDDWQVGIRFNGGDFIAYRTRAFLAADVGNIPGLAIIDALPLYTEYFLTAGQYVELEERHTYTAGLDAVLKGHYGPMMFMSWLGD